MRREYLNLADARFSIRSMKHVIPPNGMAGGRDGRPGDIWINPETDHAKRLPTRYADYPLQGRRCFPARLRRAAAVTATRWRGRPSSVLADVREGCLSAEAAERDYGVVLKRERSNFVVDAAATQARRAKVTIQ